ncbi:hypothetical protein KSS87_012374 [Heliosperma pusillum]|nr:hypothetical protein KSS87_012374 [Heliosperma pusillum]
MSRLDDKDMKAVRRRLSNVANHLNITNSDPVPSSIVGLSPTLNDTYHRVHGEVSSKDVVWRTAYDDSGKEFIDIIYEKAVGEGIAKITINRPERRNAFRPLTIKEMIRAFDDARDDSSIGVIILTGKGSKAFCSGGDQALRSKDGYADPNDIGRLNVLDLQVQIRRLPKPVVAMVAGYAVGGGHILHMVCDLTIAADNAIFGQTGPKVGSFDAGYGSSIMSRLLENLEKETVKWCREMLRNSPTAIRVLKSALNAVDDGHAGLQEIGGDATLLFYGTEEGNEGKTAYNERRPPDFSKFPRRP